jgi:hypothetical protein
VPFQRRFNGKAGPYSVIHNPKIYGKFLGLCYECVLIRQVVRTCCIASSNSHIYEALYQDFQFDYGLPQDLPDVAVGETDKPQHVLVIAEKGTRGGFFFFFFEINSLFQQA